jgi:hypothetical protein
MREKILAVIKHGIYRHEIIGVFDDIELATQYAAEAMNNEPDDWHRFVVLEFEVNKVVYDGKLMVEVSRKDSKISIQIFDKK